MEDTSLTDFLDDGEEGVEDVPDAEEGGIEEGGTGEGDTGEGDTGEGGIEGTAAEPATDESSEAVTDDDSTTADDTESEPMDDVSPAETTAAWSPGTAACPDCGGSRTWRYRDGDDFVCGDCRSWE